MNPSQLAAALKLEVPYSSWHRLALDSKRGSAIQAQPASVLALFGGEEFSLLLTRRTETVETHKGQIAFPGGVVDEADQADGVPSGVSTALRETQEEVGIPSKAIQVVGALPSLRTVTGFQVTPVIGILHADPRTLELKPNPAEIDETFWVPLKILLEPQTYRLDSYPWGGVKYPIHVFEVGSHRIWGLTAEIIKNLLDRLRALKE